MKNKLFSNLFSTLFQKKDQQYSAVVAMLGFKPGNYAIYKTALRHSSVIYTKKLDLESNERLEFLGDAILDLVVSEKLYDDFPDKNEGELTKLRVKLVNRSFLNEVSIRIGIPSLLHQYVGKKRELLKDQHNIYGNALEAVIGAVYLDKGLKGARRFVESRVFVGDDEFDSILAREKDYKSRLVSYCQREGLVLDFEEQVSDKKGLFSVIVKIGEEYYGKGQGRRKKQAHQRAAETSLHLLGKKGIHID
ncbi:ribonuclease III [bacterium]|nr:ribonuclease III [bacterium]